MPKYRVKPGCRHGVGKRLGPGSIVEMSEYEAQGFLDKLELVEEAPPTPQRGEPGDPSGKMTVNDIKEWLGTNPDPAEVAAMHVAETSGQARKKALGAMESYMKKTTMKKDHTIQAPGGGFEPFMATPEQVLEWLASENPGHLQAAVVLQAEQDGHNRPEVIEALEVYIKEADKAD